MNQSTTPVVGNVAQRNGCDASLHYLRTLWSDPPAGYLLLWLEAGHRSLWFPSDRLEAVADAARKHAEHTNVYLQMALSGRDYGQHHRCKAADAIGIPALWADVDVGTDGHKKANLPPDLAAGRELACAMPLRPSLFVLSGHGLYPFWLLKEPWIFEDTADREQGRALLRGWQSLLTRMSCERGWADLDATADFARVLRPVGTVNRKPDLPAVRVTAEIPADLRRYDPTELRAALEEALATRQDFRQELERRQSRPRGRVNAADRRRALEALARLDPKRADPYDPWLHVGMALHSVDQGDDMLEAWEEWSKESDNFEPGVCETRWNTFHADREDGLTLGSLLHWAKEDTAARQKAEADGQEAPPIAATPPTGHPLGTLTLVPGTPRRTACKLTLPVAVYAGDRQVSSLQLSNTASGRREAARQLAVYLDGQDLPAGDVQKTLDGLLVTAEAELARPADQTGETLRDVLLLAVNDFWQLTHRTRGGLWSPRHREVTLRDFTDHTPESLLAAAALARDAPPTRAGLVKATRRELGVIFADCRETLPLGQVEDLEADSDPQGREAVAEAVAEAIGRVWAKPIPYIGALRTLAGTVEGWIRTGNVTGGKFVPVFPPLKAWWLWDSPEPPRLAMSYRLAGQLNVILPGISSQRGLTLIGRKLGLIDPDPGPAGHTREGGRVVLAAALCQDILGDPPEDDSR